MIEDALKDKLQKIFKVKKVTLDLAGSSEEQECIFVNVTNCRPTIKDGQELAMVDGEAYINAVADKIPFGFFAKAIQQSDPALTKDIFFFDIESNTKRMGNLVQRGFSFVYLYKGDYDPEHGELTSLNITIEESNT